MSDNQVSRENEFSEIPHADPWHSGRIDLWIFIGFVVLTLCIFNKVITGSNDPVSNSLNSFEPWKSSRSAEDIARHESYLTDPTTQTYPWTYYANENLKRGDFPLWNTRIFSGTPFVANRLTGLLNPVILLPVKFLPPLASMTVFYFIHALLAIWFMYLFLKSLGIARWVSVFGAIAYLLQGTFFFWGSIYASADTYFVMSLYYLNRTLDKRDNVGIIGFILSFALDAMTGYPLSFVHTFYIILSYAIIYGSLKKGPVFSRFAVVTIMVACAFLLAAVQNIPTLEFFQQSLRSGTSFREGLLTQSPVEKFDSPVSLLALFFPQLWGDYLTGQISVLPSKVLPYYNHAYVGILAVFLAMFAPVVRRDRRAMFFTILAILGALFIAWQGFYMIFVRILPGFRISGAKPYFMLFFSLIVVGSYVLDHLLAHLQSNPDLQRKLDRATFWLLAAIIGLSALIIASLLSPFLFKPEELRSCLQIVKAFVFVWIATWVVQLYSKRKLGIVAVIVLIIGLELVDLIPYNLHYKMSIPHGRSCFQTPSLAFLQDKMASEGPFRVFRDSKSTLPPNSLTLFDLDEPGGYDSLITSSYADFFRSIDPEMVRNSRTLDLPNDYETYKSPFWSFLGVRYLVSPTEMTRLPLPWVLVAHDDLWIYENPQWLTRWFLVSKIIPAGTIDEGFKSAQEIEPSTEAVVEGIDPAEIPSGMAVDADPSTSSNSENLKSAGTVTVQQYFPDESILNVTADRDALLVFSDTYFPGWRAWIDGEEVRIYRTDGVVKGVLVPSGAHVVRFLYDPVSLKIGWFLLAAGLVLTPISMVVVIKLMNRYAAS
jgi:hypothetical protein